MLARSLKTSLTLLLAGVVVGDQALLLRGQEIAPPAASAPAADAPAVPKGVEVLARGPIHEAFASLTTEAAPTKPVGKQPPKPLDEMPPAEKPEGDVVWIGGYWAYDDDRNDFLWVSGTWRATPPGKQWVAGYWREDDGKWQWVAGFWNTPAAKEKDQQDVTYLPQPPALPQVALPGEAPNAESFYVPGHWVWKGDRYGWQSGYWGKVEPGYVWVAGHYSWTPGGYVYVAGYWDYAVSKRGILYAPVFIDRNVVAVGYVYTPCYAVRETIVVDSLFVRPSRCHYYFGDYYGVEYRDMGYQSCVVYSRDHYDSIIVYERYEHRREPDWVGIQINVYNDRYEHRDSRPPRTLVQQNTVINNTTIINNNNTVVNNNVNSVKTVNNTNNVLAPATQIAAAKGVRTVPVDSAARVQAQQQAVAVQQVSVQRAKSEVAAPGAAATQPRVASLTVPQQQPIVTKPVTPAVAATPATTGGVKMQATTTTGTKPATTGTTPTTTTTAVKSPAATTAMTPATTTTPSSSAGVKPLPTTTATTHATTTTGATATKPSATATATTPTTTTTTPTPSHPATQLQPVVAPPPGGAPFGSGAGAKPANPPATTTANGPPAKTTGTGQPAVQPPGTHPNPPAKPVDPPRKPVPPKDKENKDKDKDR